MDIEPNRVYTFDEVLKVLKLSPVTLRKLVRNGNVYASRLGKQYRFLGAELIRALEKRPNELSNRTSPSASPVNGGD